MSDMIQQGISRMGGEPARKKSPLVKVLLALSLLAILVVVGLVKSFLEFEAERKQYDVFKPHIESYLQLAAEGEPGEGEPYVSGKIITVAADSKVVDTWALSRLPEDLRARTPDEVGTVALYKKEWKKVGQYVSEETGERTRAAYRGFAYLTLIDWRAKTVIGSRTFKGKMPRKRISEDSSGAGGLPMWDVWKYIGSLPRR